MKGFDTGKSHAVDLSLTLVKPSIFHEVGNEHVDASGSSLNFLESLVLLQRENLFPTIFMSCLSVFNTLP
jgi:hypothetical protein